MTCKCHAYRALCLCSFAMQEDVRSPSPAPSPTSARPPSPQHARSPSPAKSPSPSQVRSPQPAQGSNVSLRYMSPPDCPSTLPRGHADNQPINHTEHATSACIGSMTGLRQICLRASIQHKQACLSIPIAKQLAAMFCHAAPALRQSSCICTALPSAQHRMSESVSKHLASCLLPDNTDNRVHRSTQAISLPACVHTRCPGPACNPA